MTEQSNYDSQFLVFLAGLTVIILSLLALYFIRIRPFLEERHYIKMEIKRSFDETERKQWQKELRMLYIRQIPFIWHFFDK